MANEMNGLPTPTSRSSRAVLPFCVLALLMPSSIWQSTKPQTPLAPQINFIDLAERAGLTAKMVYGGEHVKKYILESTGSGAAVIDYDNDGWPDIFLVNGSTLEGFPKGQEPTSHLYRNNRDGTFTDVTQKSGAALAGWGQGVCAGDYDNDGRTDLFVTFWGHNVLLHNNGDGTFTDATKKAGLWHDAPTWSTGCAFVDYNRDGHLGLFVAHYVDFDSTTLQNPVAGSACDWQGIPVFCGPLGLKGTHSQLFRNNGDGTFTDVSQKSGISATPAYYCFTPLTADFDNDGWPDVYVSCDSTASMFFHNNRDGTFTENALAAGVAFNEDGHTQAGMGVSAADYDGDGFLDILKTNFSGDTPTLYRNSGDGTFADVTLRAGLGGDSHFLGWGALFLDVDDDGWPDLFMANGHVYPEIDGKELNSTFRERKVLYWNDHNGKFKDVSLTAGPGITSPFNSHGVASADFHNDGAVEILVNNAFDRPSLLRNTAAHGNWILLKLIGTKSNRDAIGARITLRASGHEQSQEVRSGGSYISQSDFRLHFGLGEATKVDTLQIRWPSGTIQNLVNIPANQILTIKEFHESAPHP
jgi:enediyne biosynthesis protein E4